jgi:ribosomal protein L34
MIIDLTRLTKKAPEEDDSEEPEMYCQLHHIPVKMFYCDKDSKADDEQLHYKAGQFLCPSCGVTFTPTTKKRKEKKGPRIRKASSGGPGFIAMFSTHPDAFDGYFDKKQEEMYPEIEDEDSVYESMGATISQTDTFYPNSNKTITRKKHDSE